MTAMQAGPAVTSIQGTILRVNRRRLGVIFDAGEAGCHVELVPASNGRMNVLRCELVLDPRTQMIPAQGTTFSLHREGIGGVSVEWARLKRLPHKGMAPVHFCAHLTPPEGDIELELRVVSVKTDHARRRKNDARKARLAERGRARGMFV